MYAFDPIPTVLPVTPCATISVQVELVISLTGLVFGLAIERNSIAASGPYYINFDHLNRKDRTLDLCTIGVQLL